MTSVRLFEGLVLIVETNVHRKSVAINLQDRRIIHPVDFGLFGYSGHKVNHRCKGQPFAQFTVA